MAMEIGSAVAGNTISKVVIDPVIELMKVVIQKEENLHILQADVKRMENLLLDINTIFRDQQKALPQTVKDWLENLEKSLEEAKKLLHRSEARQGCLDCLMCNPVRLPKQIREWKVSFDKLYQQLKDDFSTIVNSQQIAKSAPERALPQDVPDDGFKGSGIFSAQREVQKWLTEADQVHIIGVYGLAGVGKTSCLKLVYNNYILDHDHKFFEHVIWVTVSADYKPLVLQRSIAEAIHLELPSNSDINTQKMKLSESLRSKQFLLVLDDLWSLLDLQELGVVFGRDKHSKVLFSTRRRDLILAMKAEKSIEIQPLSPNEAWTLFQSIAFNDGTVSVSMNIEECARKIADECKGLPLAITVVAAAMYGKTSADDWEASLELMKTADPSFTETHPRVDKDLYQRLRWSSDALPTSNIKNCFLYCAMYPEDAEIPVQELVQIWIAEGLVRSKQQSHLADMAIGRSYVNLLLDRCLLQNVSNKETKNVWKWQSIRVHDVVRDMAIYVGEKEENCVFKAGQQLQNFPDIQNDYCKRISLYSNGIQNLSTEFTCPKLVSLFLSANQIKEVPSGFLVSLTSLKVLHLSQERISSIPSSVGQLKQLQFLDLSNLNIQDLPEDICHLSSLQFLDISNNFELRSLPSKSGELKNLKYLSINYCSRLRAIPHEISQLTSLSTLDAYEVRLSVEAKSEASIWSLKGLRNLRMLRIRVDLRQEGIKVGIMGTWVEMRHLWLIFPVKFYYAIDDVLPEDMQKMSKLQSFITVGYPGLSLPDYTCKFEQLEYLQLVDCPCLSEVSPLERLPNLKFLKLRGLEHLKELGIGKSKRSSGFLMLEELVLIDLVALESMTGAANDLWNEAILPHLRVLKITWCPSLERLPKGMEKLQSLRRIVGPEDWWQSIRWEDENMKSHLQSLFIKR